MLYDIVMTSLLVGLTAGAIWASIKIEQARKAGKIRYVGKVNMDETTTTESIGAVTLNQLRSTCNKSVSSGRAVELAKLMEDACGPATVEEFISGATCLIMFQLMELQRGDNGERPTGLDQQE